MHPDSDCRLPALSPDLLVMGFSCRPYSAQRAGSHVPENVQNHEDFHLAQEAIEFTFKTRPIAVLYENVRRFLPRVPNFLEQLRAGGYHAGFRILPLDPWVGACSTRVYIFALNASQVPSGALGTVINIVDDLDRARRQMREEDPPMLASQFMVSPGTPMWMKHVQPLLQVGNLGRDDSPSGESSAWIRESKELRNAWHQQGLKQQNANPWSEASHPPTFRGLQRCPRLVEVIELGFLWGSLKLGLSPFKNRAEIAKNLFVDVTQNPSRHPWSYGLHRITTGSQIYSYQNDRVMSAFEAFRVYGWQDACQPIKFK